MNYPHYSEKNNGAPAPGAPAGPVYQQPPPGAAPPYNPAPPQHNYDYNASRGYHGGGQGQQYQHYAPPAPGQQQYYGQQPYYPQQQQPGGYPQYVYVHQVPRTSPSSSGVLGCLSAVLAGICCAGLLC
ncbi:hypothetical protein GGH91_005910 [Coemansia sp. RSA 2671]|uniref:Cysteine-rich transmembrane CYSTM domain-containing protein n=2 Tax=Coemansia TaxID=4863 RepID=A0A9W8GKE3_9FUNG|nr:hypothetical protein LPJ60_005278 [Coemansia sp. RSA 2675]KAJ2333564.1 hypothetical protein GGH91_005910 [Coemansia sp. RSA 2671]KAJ2691092.1 hypothetical protein IWW39_000300 [Coemansia spiralis]KAJ2698866.1 hypothetical protein H4218_002991 [Coemansia sp. IMI 209128]